MGEPSRVPRAFGLKGAGGLRRRLFELAGLLFCSSVAYSATIAGTVRGPDGAAFRGAFAVAQNAETGISVFVLSDSQGHYRIPNLPAGQYRLFIRAVGYKADAQTGLDLTASQRVSSEVGEAGFPISVGKMARFDPRTETFKEYPLPGPDPSPYALGFDAGGYLWYTSLYMDTVNRFDTRTGKVTEYPFPHPEMTMRELLRDAQGRMWYGSNPNNKVGYFYLAGQK